VHDLVFTHRVLPGTWTEWESAQAFLTGKIAMGWFISPGISYGEKYLPWKLGIAHIPRFNGGRQGLMSGTALVSFARSRKKQKAALDFMFWLTQKENDIRLFERIGFVPIRRSSVNSLEVRAFVRENPRYRVPLEAIEYARPLPNHTEFLKINQEIARMLQRIILRKADIEVELRRTEEKINGMIE
jgi:sn-glycerol 3-phosphate transport system substrate-binding protein